MFISAAIMFCFVFLTGMSGMVPASYSPEVNASYDQLKTELQQKGFDIQKITDAAKPVKDLLAQGVKKEEVKRFVLDLYDKNLDKESFKDSLASVSELVRDGEAYRKARNLVSSTIDKAQKQGLKGKEMAKKVSETIAERKSQLEGLKSEGMARAKRTKEGIALGQQDAQGKSFWDFFKGKPQPQPQTVAPKPQPASPSQTFAVSGQQPISDVAKDLDNAIRPILKNLFSDARIISESKSAQTKADGEVLENFIIYKVKKNLIVQDGYALHSAFRSAGFASSPRLGSKPSEWRGNVAMSLMRTTSLRPYSLVINVDTNKQQITVESYKTGSKYDRLM